MFTRGKICSIKRMKFIIYGFAIYVIWLNINLELYNNVELKGAIINKNTQLYIIKRGVRN